MSRDRRSARSTPAGRGRAAPLPVLDTPAPRPKFTGGDPPCHDCPAKCCRYIALQIDAPTTPEDYDQIRWYLLHQDVVVWVDDGDWHLEFRARCKVLQPDNTCGAYDTRPGICREYGSPENGPCEYYSEGNDFELLFDSAEEFESYARVQIEKRERRLERRRRQYRRRKAAGATEVTR